MITTHYNYNLTSHNTLAMNVECSCYMEYTAPEDIPFILSSIRKDVERMHIGGGSNLLFTTNYPGVVLHSAIKGIETIEDSEDHIIVKVGSGVVMDEFIRWACDNNLWGVENLSGIPGEVGASAVQNIGAYGVEACDSIVRVHVYDDVAREFTSIDVADCDYGYRMSMFKRPADKGRYIIHAVEYCLSKHPNPVVSYPALKASIENIDIKDLTPNIIRETITKIRNGKLPDPAKVPSAGSFFMNPIVDEATYNHVAAVVGGNEFPHYDMSNGYKIPAAWLIDQCGWKGKQRGNAGVWHLQPLVLVNPERKASPSEILDLEKEIVRSVQDKFGITLTPEVEHI